jgi:hypothetical protein
MGWREPIRCSTLADANEARDWRIDAGVAQRLITHARQLYAGETLGIDLTNSVYVFDSTTIDLCMSMFPRANFRIAKSAVKMHTLLDLRRNIPSFIHVSDCKLAHVYALDPLIPEAGATYVMDCGYIDYACLYAQHQVGALFVSRAKPNLLAHWVYSAPTDRNCGMIADRTIALDAVVARHDYPAHLRRVRLRAPDTGNTLIFLANRPTLRALACKFISDDR